MGIFQEDILQGKVALVTGGATGIGKVIAETLAQHGAHVVIVSRKEAGLSEVCETFLNTGLSCSYAVADIRDSDRVNAVIAQIIEDHGRLDILINNAAGNFPAPISGISSNGFKTIVDIDLVGTYHTTKAVFDLWMKENGGSIVNLSAPFQNGGAAYQSHVAAAKAGVDSLTRTSAVEFGPYGVRVNAVAPGATADTEGLKRFEQGAEKAKATNPLGFVGSKSDIANSVLFLTTEAARYINGQILVVDGGASVDLFKLNGARID